MDVPPDSGSNTLALVVFILEQPGETFYEKCLSAQDRLKGRMVEVGARTEEGLQLMSRLGKIGEYLGFDKKPWVDLPQAVKK